MNYLIIFTYIFAITFIIFFVYEYNTKDKRKISTKFYSLIQTIAVIITLAIALHSILLSIDSLQKSNESNERTIEALNNITTSTLNVKNVLDTVSFKLAMLPPQLQAFSNIVNVLNESLIEQQNKFSLNINSLEKRVSSFEKNLSKYDGLITNYSNTLKYVTNLTNQQLDIWEKQQEITLKEFSRRPKLFITPVEYELTDTTIVIKGISITNEGNIEANIESIVFTLPQNNFIKVLPAKEFVQEETLEAHFNYQWIKPANSFNEMIIINGISSIVKNLEFVYRIDEITKSTLEYYPYIKYRIIAVSKYSSEPFTGSFNYKRNLFKYLQ